MTKAPSATDIVHSYLGQYGPPRELDGVLFVYSHGSETLSADFLTRWVWEYFQQVPRRAAVSDAFAVLRSLAVTQPQLDKTA